MKRLIAIQQSLKVAKDKDGYGYKYRDAEQILAAAKDVLAETKCAVICNAEYKILEGKLIKVVTATLYGEDGKAIASASDQVKSAEEMKGMQPQQISGSDTTYCKRYALQNLFAIDNGEDDPDDKNNPLNPRNQKAQAKAQPKPAQAPAAPKAQPKPAQASALADVKDAVGMNLMHRKLDDCYTAKRIDKATYDAKMVQLAEHGRKIGCTFTDSDGWVNNEDLFGEDALQF